MWLFPVIHSLMKLHFGVLLTLFPQILLGLPMLEDVNPASRFPCSAIGHEAACYSRIWSEVCHPSLIGKSQTTHPCYLVSQVCNDNRCYMQ